MRQLISALLLVCSATTAVAADKYTLHTELYPPYQEMKGGKLEGDSVKVIRELFKRAKLSFDIKVDKWEKSFEAAKKDKFAGVFTTIRTPEREDSFKWVGPISVNRWIFLARKDRKISIKNINEAQFYKIGGYVDDAKSDYLEQQGFVVNRIADDSKNAERLIKGEIDIWATGHISGPKYAKEAGVLDQLREVYAFREDYGYLAMNIDTKANVILDLNRILDQMKDAGQLPTVKFK